MARLYYTNLFSWKDVNQLGDLERFILVRDTIPDEKLIRKLERERKNGRDDYPVRATWNSLLAGILFQHPSVESLRRELRRNAQLREMCGFEPILGTSAVPTSIAYSRFLSKLIDKEVLVNDMFQELVESLREILPDFGKEIAFDGKALASLSNGKKNEDLKETSEKKDLRKEHDANWGTKKYTGTDEKGTVWSKVKSWFGFRLHLIVDANYELPIAYQLTKASTGEQPVMRELFKELAKAHPELVKNCEHGMGDRGYDSVKTITVIWEECKIKPVIDIKNMWKDGEGTRLLKTRDIKNVTYNFKGEVYCHCPTTDEIRKMTFGGFEEDRQTLKYLCPAKQYGFECKGAKNCSIKCGLRIPLEEDKRIFTPVARSSYKWKKLYNKRSSVERVNSRIDLSFGFERHFIRGLKKM